MADLPDRADPLLAGRLRLLLFISDLSILCASVVLAIAAGRGWAWGPFIVGLLVVAGAAAANGTVLAAGVKVLRPGHDELRRVRARQRNRTTRLIYPGYVTFAVSLALVSGALKTYWPDIGLAGIFVVTSVIFPLVLLPVLYRRAASRMRSTTKNAVDGDASG